MRLLYQERLAPGKQLDLIKSVYKNLFLTYMPSAGVSIFLLVIISLSESASQNYCWRTVVSRELLDCLIYFTCFVLPNLLGLTIISIYLYLYLRLPGPAHSCFLAYPLLMMAFNVYSLVVKLYLFFQTMESAGSLQYPNVLLPLVFALYLLYGYWRTNSVKNTRLSE